MNRCASRKRIRDGPNRWDLPPPKIACLDNQEVINTIVDAIGGGNSVAVIANLGATPNEADGVVVEDEVVVVGDADGVVAGEADGVAAGGGVGVVAADVSIGVVEVAVEEPNLFLMVGSALVAPTLLNALLVGKSEMAPTIMVSNGFTGQQDTTLRSRAVIWNSALCSQSLTMS